MNTEKLTCRKGDFSLPDDRHYLNCAYMAPLSKRVQEAGFAGVRRKAVPFEIRSADFFTDCDRLRWLFGRLINAPDPRQVAIVPSASYALAQIARNSRVRKGQSIVTVKEEFPSNVYIWRRLCAETGARLDCVEPPVEGPEGVAAWNDALLEAIDHDTAIVTLSQVHYTDGTLFDLERIGRRAREVGAALIVDGSQATGALPIDVQRLQPDALICPAYKWLMGPYSIGAAWFSPRYDEGVPIEESWMTREGSDDFAGLVNYTDRYRAGAIRYDVGETSNFILVPMMIAGLEQVLEWRPERIGEYGRALTAGLMDEIRNAGLAIAPDNRRAGHLFGIRLAGRADVETLQGRLRDRRVYVSVRGAALRVSVHLYNDEADIQALRDALFN
jgi:selenocysteine lyase/cysteine desulfurase